MVESLGKSIRPDDLLRASAAKSLASLLTDIDTERAKALGGKDSGKC